MEFSKISAKVAAVFMLAAASVLIFPAAVSAGIPNKCYEQTVTTPVPPTIPQGAVVHSAGTGNAPPTTHDNWGAEHIHEIAGGDSVKCNLEILVTSELGVPISIALSGLFAIKAVWTLFGFGGKSGGYGGDGGGKMKKTIGWLALAALCYRPTTVLIPVIAGFLNVLSGGFGWFGDWITDFFSSND